MAGEWIKMECATPDKPEVLALTVKLGWDDPDLTVGKLFRLWRWFDQQTTDGNAHGVSAALLDKQVGVSGFIQALSEVGWVEFDSDGVRLLGFEKHNGATAKSRAQTAKRVANHKGNAMANAKTNAPSVSEALPREEKKREEKKEEGRERASRIPPNFEPKPEPEAESGIDRPLELANFRDYWTAKSGAQATKLDWQATWRQWARKADRPGISRFAKPAQNITVPGRPGIDPEILKAENDRKNAAPMPTAIREFAQRIKTEMAA